MGIVGWFVLAYWQLTNGNQCQWNFCTQHWAVVLSLFAKSIFLPEADQNHGETWTCRNISKETLFALGETLLPGCFLFLVEIPWYLELSLHVWFILDFTFLAVKPLWFHALFLDRCQQMKQISYIPSVTRGCWLSLFSEIKRTFVLHRKVSIIIFGISC